MAMKTFTISISCLIVGIVLGYYFTPQPYPIKREESTIHYCGCIQDQPEFQRKVLDVSNAINERIGETKEEFAQEHGIESHHFDATFIPLGNGCYTIKYWCSNRSTKVAGLFSTYKEHVHTLLAPHREILKEAHNSHQQTQKLRN